MCFDFLQAAADAAGNGFGFVLVVYGQSGDGFAEKLGIEQAFGVDAGAVVVFDGGVAFFKEVADDAVAGQCDAECGIFAAEDSEEFVLRKAAAGEKDAAAEYGVAADGHLQPFPCGGELRVAEVVFGKADRTQFEADQAEVGIGFQAEVGGIEDVVFIDVVGVEEGDEVGLALHGAPVAGFGGATIFEHVFAADFGMDGGEVAHDKACVVDGGVVNQPDVFDGGLGNGALDSRLKGGGGVVAGDDDV